MIWLTWRQFRAQAVAASVALAALAGILALTGPRLAHDYSTGMAGCTAQGGCGGFIGQFIDHHQTLYFGLAAVVLFLPAVIGLFWGAPLVSREFEAGTHGLVWSQSVTRGRWLIVKLGLIGVAAMAAGGLASLAVYWWSSPLDTAAHDRFPRLAPPLFDARGIVPIGYAAFAFALGVTIGILVRRTVPAMAIVLTAFVAIQIAMPLWVRPHLIAPAHATVAITADNLDGLTMRDGLLSVQVKVDTPDAWVLSNQTVNAAGQVVDSLPASLSTGACAPHLPAAGGPTQVPAGSRLKGPPISPDCFTALRQLGYGQQVTYQPGSRFWTFQWYETAIFLGLALALAGFSFWWVRRLS
jgi:hypothetical protein